MDKMIGGSAKETRADLLSDVVADCDEGRRLLGRMWDQGIASGLCDRETTMLDIKAEARRRSGRA
jgi:hypothetical protein